MVQQMGGMSPYSMLSLRSEWPSGSRMTLQAGNHMTGAIDLTDGPPSTVTAQINLLSSLAEGQRARVERDMIALAQQHLPAVAGAEAGPTFPPPAPPTGEPAAPGTTPQQPTTTSRPFNWDIFGSVMTGLFGSAASITNQINQVGQEAAGEAIYIAQEEAGKQASPIGSNTGLQHGDGFTLGQGKAVSPDAPLPGGRLPSEVPAGEGVEDVEEVGFPTWGWWAIGLGGATAIGLVAYFVTRDEDDGFESNAKHSTHSSMTHEALSMRAAGHSVSEIAGVLGLSQSLVQKMIRDGIEKSKMSQNYGFRYYF